MLWQDLLKMAILSCHLSRLKKFYHAEGERLKRILKQSVLLPAVSVDGGESGTHLLVKVDTSMTDTEIEEAAENMGIHISCLSGSAVRRTRNMIIF